MCGGARGDEGQKSALQLLQRPDLGGGAHAAQESARRTIGTSETRERFLRARRRRQMKPREGAKRRCKPFTVGGREAGGRKRADRQRKRCRLQRAQSPRRLQRDQRRRRRSGSDRGNTWDARGTDRETEGSRACGRRLRHARQLPRSY